MVGSNCKLTAIVLEEYEAQMKGYMFTKNTRIDFDKFNNLVTHLRGHYEALTQR